jgi:ribosomal biogenesis protein LAS1
LPSLTELKRAAQDSLDWLWDWYWSQLDYAFGTAKNDGDGAEVEGTETIREKLQAIMKTYVKERKSEIKTRRKDSRAAGIALSTYNLRYVPSNRSTSSSLTQNILLRLLVDEKMILPTDKKLGSSMSGAFLIWDPLLLAFSQSIMPTSVLLTQLLSAMNTASASRAMLSTEMDPIREGMYEWILHILRSNQQHVEQTLITCFSEPTHWNLRVAQALLEDDEVKDREQWVAVLKAARSEDETEMEVDVEGIDQGLPVRQEKAAKEKTRGPQKVMGLWKPRPIGWIPEGWEDDE